MRYGTLHLGKHCDVCGTKTATRRLWLPNWKEYVFVCRKCTRAWSIDAEAMADDIELGNVIVEEQA